MGRLLSLGRLHRCEPPGLRCDYEDPRHPLAASFRTTFRPRVPSGAPFAAGGARGVGGEEAHHAFTIYAHVDRIVAAARTLRSTTTYACGDRRHPTRKSQQRFLDCHRSRLLVNDRSRHNGRARGGAEPPQPRKKPPGKPDLGTSGIPGLGPAITMPYRLPT